MYAVMESFNDVIVVASSEVASHRAMGFKLAGMRKTIKGAERLAEKRCEF